MNYPDRFEVQVETVGGWHRAVEPSRFLITACSDMHQRKEMFPGLRHRIFDTINKEVVLCLNRWSSIFHAVHLPLPTKDTRAISS